MIINVDSPTLIAEQNSQNAPQVQQGIYVLYIIKLRSVLGIQYSTAVVWTDNSLFYS